MDTTAVQPWLQQSIDTELEWVKTLSSEVDSTVYDGFVVHRFGNEPFLLETVHNGYSTPPPVRFFKTKKERAVEEDLFTGELYAPTAAALGGTWVSVHVSRYLVDLNRSIDRAVLQYDNDDREWNAEENEFFSDAHAWANTFYSIFYSVFSTLIHPDTYLVNGHTMRAELQCEKRPAVELLGPTNLSCARAETLFLTAGFAPISCNTIFEYDAGEIVSIANSIRPQKGQALEINKKLYLQEDEQTPIPGAIEKHSKKLTQLLAELYNTQ